MAKPAHHIVFICSRMDLPGGTEHAIVRTANLLLSAGYRVSLLILDETDRVYFDLNKNVQVVSAHLHFGINAGGNVFTRKLALWRHTVQLGRMLQNMAPDVVIATEYHFAAAARFATRKLNSRLYAWEHHHFRELEKSRFWNYLFRKSYPALDAVICLNEEEAGFYSAMGAKTVVIPNYIEKQNESGRNHQTIITVARLSFVKGIDRLIEVATQVLKKHASWKWCIIGDGPFEDAIRQTIERESLEERLILLPPQGPDLSAYYQHSDVYVMTSRNECFPMVLLEAMSHGLPCVAFDCETGPRAIIRNGEDGVLLPDGNIGEMVKAISSLIGDVEKLKAMGIAARKNVDRFAPEKVLALWRQLFDR